MATTLKNADRQNELDQICAGLADCYELDLRDPEVLIDTPKWITVRIILQTGSGISVVQVECSWTLNGWACGSQTHLPHIEQVNDVIQKMLDC